MLPNVMNMAPGAVDVSFQYVEARIDSLQERVAGLERIIYSDEDADLRDVGESDREPVDVDSDTSADEAERKLIRSAVARKREAAKKALKKKPAAIVKAMIITAKKAAVMKKTTISKAKKKPAVTMKKATHVGNINTARC